MVTKPKQVKGNGHKDEPGVLENPAGVVTATPEAEKPQPKLDKKELKEIEKSKISESFSIPGQQNLVDELIRTGDNFLDLLMRADIPNPRYGVAASYDYNKCAEFNDKIGIADLKGNIAMRCGIKGKRAELAADTYAGNERRRNRGGGIGDYLIEKAGLNDKGGQK